MAPAKFTLSYSNGRQLVKIVNVTPMVMGTARREVTFVKVETDDGLVGVGEVRSVNHTGGVLGFLPEAVSRYVLGTDPFDVEKLVHRMMIEDFERMSDISMSAIALI